MPGEEYNYIPGDLARQDLYPDERKMQPPQDQPWPYQAQASPQDPQPWQAPPTDLARWPVDPSQMDASEAAAFRTQSRYRNALARDPTSNRLGDLAQTIAPQSPLDYALLASGPIAKAASVPVRAALYGGAMAMDPEAAQASFAGKLSRTANLDMLKKAEEMLQYGKSGSDIRNETNWFPSAGGILKYEIPDRGSGWIKGAEPSKLKFPAGQSMTMPMGDAFNHPELYDAYPELANIPLTITKSLGKNTRGGYAPPLEAGDPGRILLAPGSGKGMRDVNLHELGHANQDLNNWPVGSNPYRLFSEMKEGTPQWDIYQRMRADATTPMSWEEFSDMAKETGIPVTPEGYKSYFEAAQNVKLMPSTEDRLKRMASDEAYRATAGEVESRNIQTRKDFTPEQIWSIPPHVSQSIPYDKQIIQYRNAPVAVPPASEGAPWELGSLADQSMQLSTKDPGLTGFAPGPKGTGRPLASPEEITRAAAESRQGMTQPELRQLYDQLGLTGGAPSELVSKSLARSQPASAIEEATRLKLADREVLNSLTPDQRLAYQKGKPLPEGVTLPSQEAARPALEKYLPIKKEVARAEKEFDAGQQMGSLFDLSPQTLNKIPDVPQYPLPRVAPKETARLEPAARGGLARIERAAAAAPEENWGWYNLMQQRDLMHQLHGPVKGEQAFNALLDSTAGTSMLNPIDNNLRSATWYLQQVMQGKPLPQVLHITDPTTGQTVKTMAGGPPPGYGAKSQIQHADRVREYMSNQYDPVANPKPISYRTNLSGNYVPRTVDTHDIRNIVGMPGALKAFGENSTLLPGEYTHLEDVGARAAKRAGTPQAPQQAATWVGGGEYTGLKSYPAPLAAAINRRAHVTAKVRGQTPEQALEDAFTGKMPLLGIGGAAVMGGLAAQDDYR